jgi:hypothetical protein
MDANKNTNAMQSLSMQLHVLDKCEKILILLGWLGNGKFSVWASVEKENPCGGWLRQV